MFWCISSLLAVVALLASPASAATMRTFSIGSWLGGAYTNDTTNAFNHCAASGSYASGITVTFAISQNFNWSMGFAHPAWRLQRGSVFDIAFTVDDTPPIIAKATALSAIVVEVPLDDSAELFARFRRGYVLRVAAASQVFSFNLTGTSQLLPALLTCAQNRGTVVRMASNPFDVKSSSSSGSNALQDAGAKAEATALAANLLSAAGVQGFTLLNPAEYPEIKGDARWIQGATFGTLNIYPKVTREELKNISAYLIGGDAKACKGTFFSGAIPDSAAAPFGRVFTTCQTGDNTLTSYYLAAPRKAGGAYVISTISLGPEKPAKEADSLLRSAVFKALPN
jgi:hypothetical protein